MCTTDPLLLLLLIAYCTASAAFGFLYGMNMIMLQPQVPNLLSVKLVDSFLFFSITLSVLMKKHCNCSEPSANQLSIGSLLTK